MEKAKNSLNNLIFFIIGTTAAGKTKLSLSLASKCNGEIISCDSMQIYKKVDIMTAKATPKEQSVAKHHMLSVLEVNETNFTRNDYFYKSYDIAQKLFEQNKVPVIVGGTHYYIETILFNQKVQQIRDKQQLDPEKIKLLDQLEELSPQELFQKLQELDPLLANKVHQNNTKRVKSYLRQILEDDNQTPLSSNMEDHMEVPLRNENCLVFWPRCKDKQKLKVQQLKRIKEMVDEGGLQEALLIIEELIGKDIDPKKEGFLENPLENEKDLLQRGVLQSIGYKEFLPIYKYCKFYYPEVFQKIELINELKKDKEEVKKIIDQCIERLHINTYHLAKKQIQWIKHRIITNSGSVQMKKRLFVLEFEEYTSENFNEMCVKPALMISQSYMDYIQKEKLSPEEAIEKLNENKELSQYLVSEKEMQEIQDFHQKKNLEDWKNYRCDVCEIKIHGEQQYKQHMSSRKHAGRKKFLEKLKTVDKNSKHYQVMLEKEKEYKRKIQEMYEASDNSENENEEEEEQTVKKD